MISDRKLRSADNIDKEGESQLNTNLDSSERMSSLERSVGELTKMLFLISRDLNDLKINSELKPKPTKDDTSVKTNVIEQTKEIGGEAFDPKVHDPMITDRNEKLIDKVKLNAFFNDIFKPSSKTMDFREYKVLLSFIDSMQQKFAFHSVPENLKIQLFLRMIDGTENLVFFFRFHLLERELSDDYSTISPGDIQKWKWSDFKKEFMRLFLPKGTQRDIIEELARWDTQTFSNSNVNVISQFEMNIRHLSEVNKVNGGETDVNSLKQTHKGSLIKTLQKETYKEIIQLMEVSKSIIYPNYPDINDLKYEELINILMTIKSKKEIENSMFKKSKSPNDTANKSGNEPSKYDAYKKLACHQYAAENCNLGEKCLYSHDIGKINEYKKSIGEKVEKK